MAKLSELLNKLDADKNVRGNQFEHICKWYLENDPKYALELKKVWLWDDWPGKWGPDAGIDLVAKTYDNKLWAVQAKAYNPDHSIRKADIDSFLSESSREVFSYRLLITTTSFIGRTAEQTLHAQEKPVGTILLSDLEKSAVKWPISPEKLESKPPELKKPQPHQQKAIADVCKGFSDNNRGQLIMACGTGKTLVALWAMEKIQSQRTLILLPSLSLLAQTLREWAANTSQAFHYLPVCSDDTVRGADHFTSRTSDLGLPVTTNPNEVAEFLRRRGPIIVFSTYQSSPVIAEAFTRHNVPSFDLAIADEAHRCAGIGKGTFVTILDSVAIKARKRLFMTATPRYFTDKVHQEADKAELDIASMDDESKFGPVFHQLNFSEAIEKDLLCDYQVVIIGIDNTTYLRYAESGMFVTTDGKHVVDARNLASHIALVKAMRKYDLRRIISFHSRIKRAKKFSDELPDVIEWMPEDSRPTGAIWSKHVSGEMSSGKRDAFLSRFRHLEDGERGLLSNVRCLGEGVDVPALDGIAFIDPRNSQLDIVQAVGRVIRKAPNKKIGTVVLPVFVDSDQDHEIALDSSVFKPVWNVLKALRAHDNVISDSLDQLRRQMGRNDSTKIELPSKLFIDMPVTIGKTFVESLHVKIVELSTPSWEFFFGLLQQYIEDKGHSLVPRKYITKDGYKLGQWVMFQQSSYRKGKFLLSRQTQLEQLPGWVWDHSEALWQEGYRRLVKFIEHEGHANVLISYVTEDNFNLGTWVNSQHAFYRKNKLPAKRQKALELLQGWAWKYKSDDLKVTSSVKWPEGFFQLLCEYVKDKGHSYVQRDYVTKDGYHLGRWVLNLRKAYEQGRLTKEQQNALEKLPGWEWSTKDKNISLNTEQGWQDTEQGWQVGYKHLVKFIEHEGHTAVTSKYLTEDGYKLGTWVRNQRSKYSAGELPKNHEEALESTPRWVWNVHKEAWTIGFKYLCKYLEQEGHPNVPRGYITKDGYKLGQWVMFQRQQYRQGKMSRKRQETIAQLPNWNWHPKRGLGARNWNKSLKYLHKYIEREGHACVPSGYLAEDGFRLGAWVAKQRQAYKRDELSVEQQKELEQLQNWRWQQKNPMPKGWCKSLEYLRKYVEREGHACVPSGYLTEDGYKLGTWVINQRYENKKGRLSKEQQLALEGLPGWIWNARKKK